MGVMEKKNLDFLEQIVSKNIDMKDAGKKMLQLCSQKSKEHYKEILNSPREGLNHHKQNVS